MLRYDVKVLDNVSRKEDNLKEVIDEIKLIYGDVRDVDVVDRAVKGVDSVAHLAALTNVQESIEKPFMYHEVNSGGTLNLLNSARN